MVEKYTSDSDLVELSGYHAYIEQRELNHININGTEYEVVNTNYKDTAGLDAITVQNLSTQEYTIVYVGTDKDQLEDLLTDAYLLSSTDVPQLTAAKKYYENMDKQYGIDSVTGNSLGGALANSIAVEYPNVRSVTYNPALLPGHLVDTDKDYDNITNYIGQYDVLNMTLDSLGLGDRVPGKKHEIYNGIPGTAESKFGTIGSNHTGYLRNDEGTQYYEIRPDGGPGSGQIHVKADEHIVTSAWTGQPIYGDGSTNIRITPEALHTLANGLHDSVFNRLERASEYLSNSKEIIDDEAERRHTRINILQRRLQQIIESQIGEDMEMMGNSIQASIDDMHRLLDLIEDKGQSLNYLLNSPPAELMEFIMNRQVDVSSLVDEARNFLNQLSSNVDELMDNSHLILTSVVPKLFHVGMEKWHDAVVNELQEHFNILMNNNDILLTQIQTFQQQIEDTADTFEKTDLQLANAIQNKISYIKEVFISVKANTDNLEPSPYLEAKLDIKEIQLDLSFTYFSTKMNNLLTPVLEGINVILLGLEVTIESLSFAIKQGTNIFLRQSLPGMIVSTFTDFDDKVRNTVKNTLEPIDTLASRINGVRDGVRRLNSNIPTIINRFRPYLENALFNNERFFDVYLYNNSAIALIRELDLVFQDINSQLANHHAKTILELLLYGRHISVNINQLQEQVERAAN
ncbi:SA1320 family protein [Gracilibacillus lacisalsi]|uniref:SA1320 family protein n=1 Tax=Gracilibacillus lacisalsi TaxID=393087 RepID=UPI000374528F|nr:hypothetical protein [Gracilibacillus lacisalsi]